LAWLKRSSTFLRLSFGIKLFSACECNGWSSRCRFNEQLYQETGRGGECMGCEGYRDGQHCERCLPNHFFSLLQDERGRTPCEACDCDPVGKTIKLSRRLFVLVCLSKLYACLFSLVIGEIGG
jgi:hypothetical protein